MTANVAVETTPEIPLWNDPAHSVSTRVSALIEAMTLQEKIAQLYGVWVGASDEGGDVAPISTTWRRPSTSTPSCPPDWAS